MSRLPRARRAAVLAWALLIGGSCVEDLSVGTSVVPVGDGDDGPVDEPEPDEPRPEDAAVRRDAGGARDAGRDGGPALPPPPPSDAGKPDGGSDAGQPGPRPPRDAGRPTPGRPDAGRPDAGRPDAGNDAGQADAGPLPPCAPSDCAIAQIAPFKACEEAQIQCLRGEDGLCDWRCPTSSVSAERFPLDAGADPLDASVDAIDLGASPDAASRTQPLDAAR